MDIPVFYNKHYIKTDGQNRITAGWSDGPHPGRDTADAICINERGGYQFRLIVYDTVMQQSPGGETVTSIAKVQTQENPPLYTMEGIPLYRWDAAEEVAIERPLSEIAADIAALPAPAPTPLEQLQAENNLLKAQVAAAGDRQDFLEDCIAEMAAQVYGG